VASSAQVSSKWLAVDTAMALVIPVTATGVELSATVLPFPSAPLKLRPQQSTPPLARTAQA
jgi:hypothetical protein